MRPAHAVDLDPGVAGKRLEGTRLTLTTVLHAGRRLLVGTALSYALLLLGLSLQSMLWPQRAGVLALAQALAPLLFAPLLLAVPLALLRRTVPLRLALLGCLLVFAGRFLPLVRPAPPVAAEHGPPLTVLAWNVRDGGQPEPVRALLTTRPAAIVSLEEADWRWLTRDAAVERAYPYQAALHDDPVASIVLLSTYPIRDSGTLPLPPGMIDAPRAMWARLAVGSGPDLTVVAVHPPPAKLCQGPCRDLDVYYSAERDARLASIRAFIAPLLARGAPFLLLGDFNLTDREPAYRELTAGLHDVQAEAGQGLGATWRPEPLMGLNLALLRIDYQFSSPGIIPLGASVDCTPRGSDHCSVLGRFAIQ